jgi:hypothetical protein
VIYSPLKSNLDFICSGENSEILWRLGVLVAGPKRVAPSASTASSFEAHATRPGDLSASFWLSCNPMT